MHEYLVSVIMPTYNCGKLLGQSIDSILNQTYRNLELLITDDNSSDSETLSVLRSYSEQDERVKVLYLKENKGPGYARDKSIERAEGRYIAFCDSDDCWMPDKLERQIAFMSEHNCSLSCTSYIMRYEDGREKGITNPPERISFTMLKHDNKIGCSTAIYDTQLLGKKYYMPTIRKRQDWALFLTILRESGSDARGLREPLTYYCVRARSVSSYKIGLIKYNISIYRDILHYSKSKAMLYFYFVFIPCHILKLIRKKMDSWHYLCRKS